MTCKNLSCNIQLKNFGRKKNGLFGTKTEENTEKKLRIIIRINF